MKRRDLKLVLRMASTAYAKLEEDLQASERRIDNLRILNERQAVQIKSLKEQVASLSDRVIG